MGRNKIEIATKKTLYERKNTFNKRKDGIVKKAHELSTLCDAPTMLLFFPPTKGNSPVYFVNKGSNFEDIIQRYADVSPQERFKSKVEAFKQLQKPFAKQGKIIDVNHELMNLHGGQSAIEEFKQNHINKLKAEIEEAQNALGVLRYVDEINTIDNMKLLEAMEAALQDAISYNNARKEQFLNKQLSETANINQAIYQKQFNEFPFNPQEIHPKQFNEIPCNPQEELLKQFSETANINPEIYPKQFNEIPRTPQVNHQFQSRGLPQVANNIYSQFQVNSEAGTSNQDSIANRFRHLEFNNEEPEQRMIEGNATFFDGASCSNLTTGDLYSNGWNMFNTGY